MKDRSESTSESKSRGAPPASVRDVLRTSGQSLEPAARAIVEPAFSHDFRNVRVHADAQASRSARDMQTGAYAAGRHVVLSEPPAAASRTLIHELAHVAQNDRNVSAEDRRLSVDALGSCAERDATAAADQVTARGKAAVRSGDHTASQPRIFTDQEPSKPPAPAKPSIKYPLAKKQNDELGKPDAIGWHTALATVAAGQFKSWHELWSAGRHDDFADAVAAYQLNTLKLRGADVDGILGLKTWAQIAGLGGAMAGIRDVTWEKSQTVCTIATQERIHTGLKLAGKKLNLPKEKGAAAKYKIILQTMESHLDQVDALYRGTGAAGALVYAGLADFVPEDQIWAGGLKPGAALQVWESRAGFELLQKGPPYTEDQMALFGGTSMVFIRYDSADPTGTMHTRHFGGVDVKKKSRYEVWVAANPR